MPAKASNLAWLLPVAAAASLVGLAAVMPAWWLDTSMDVAVYWEAGGRMLAGGAGLYDDAADPANRVGLFIYPPLFAVLFAPLTVLPRELGYALWALVQLILIAANAWLALKLCAVNPMRRSNFLAVLAVGLFGALWTNVAEGQVNTLVTATLLGGLLLLERGHTWRGGLLLAAATHLKVIPIVLLPLLIAQRRFKAAGAMAAGIAVLWLAPMLYALPNYGPGAALESNVTLSREYVQQIASPRLEEQSATNLGGARAPNNALSAVAQRWFDDGHALSLRSDDASPIWTALPRSLVRWSGLAIGALLGLGAMVLAWRASGDRWGRTAAIGLGLLAAGLANLLFWPHHLCLLVLVLAPLAAHNHERPGAPWYAWAAAGTALLLCYVPLVDSVAVLDGLAILGLPTLGVLMIWGLVFVICYKRAVAAGPPPPILRAHEKADTRNSDA